MDPSEADLRTFLEEITAADWVWFAKRLSANDTGLTGSHQVGLYLPRVVALPLLGLPDDAVRWVAGVNPDAFWDLWLASHDRRQRVRLIYYNQGTRNECRLTGFGGRDSPIQDPANTSALLLLAFRRRDAQIFGWLARDRAEEDALEGVLGHVVPGIPMLRHERDGAIQLEELVPDDAPCVSSIDQLPQGWRVLFPRPEAITAHAIGLVPAAGIDPDRRLVRRYECEFRIFRLVEELDLLPKITSGFGTVDDFVSVAMTVLNRRKSRAGRALELHIAAIFDEERVVYESQVVTEPGSVVDFLFPGLSRYVAASPGEMGVQMLAVKTTLKDRWRQVVQEGKKIEPKHLFTLDEGVSLPTYRDMAARGLRLVVPRRNVTKFPEAVRGELLTLGTFLDLVRSEGG